MRPHPLLRSVALLIILSTLIGGPIAAPVQARQATRQPIGNATALGNLLNPDGTLNLQSGFNGSLDAHGWRMTTTADGTPQFNAAATGRAATPHIPDNADDEWWDGEFQTGVSYPGYAAYVYAIAVHGSDVYFGGTFQRAGGIAANSIVRYNTVTQHWYPLGTGIDSGVYAILVSGSDVYVGGDFNSVGGIAANNIAKWNSSTGVWSALGYGVTGCTGVPGCVGAVYAIAVNGTDVYVGGTFTSAAGMSSGPVARWNTLTQSWTPGAVSGCYSTGCQLAVYALAAQYNGVVVGGNFLHALCSIGVCTVNNVVYWNGSTFSPLTDGVTTGTNGDVRALFNDGYGMYLGGSFTSPRAGVTYFDGYDWFGEGSGINGTVYALTADNQYLYAGGYFSNAGGSGANRIARLPFTINGNWQPMGNGLDGTVTGLAWNGKDLIAVGRFNQSGLLGLNNIARWNTTTGAWSALGSGTGGIPFNQNWSVAATNEAIYVGGYFVSAGGKESNFLARWAHFQTYLPSLIK